MSEEVNTRLIEAAYEWADHLHMDFYTNKVNELVEQGNMEDLFSLVMDMRASEWDEWDEYDNR